MWRRRKKKNRETIFDTRKDENAFQINAYKSSDRSRVFISSRGMFLFLDSIKFRLPTSIQDKKAILIGRALGPDNIDEILFKSKAYRKIEGIVDDLEGPQKFEYVDKRMDGDIKSIKHAKMGYKGLEVPTVCHNVRIRCRRESNTRDKAQSHSQHPRMGLPTSSLVILTRTKQMTCTQESNM
jgi:hypothetical protein